MDKLYRTLIISLLFTVLALAARAQAPQKFNYQAVLRDPSGAVISNQIVGVDVKIRNSTPTGPIYYEETHLALASVYGVISLEVGNGTPIMGNFDNINWGTGLKYLEVSFDTSGGSNYISMGATQLLSVPYALYSQKTFDVDDADADPNNEIQSLSINANILSLSSSNSVAIPMKYYFAGNGISISNDSIFNLGDLSNTNELQLLNLSGNTLGISGGNTVLLPEYQYFAGQGIKIKNDTILNWGDLSNTNELQSLNLNGNILGISNGNSVVIPQTQYFAGNGIYISNDTIINTSADQLLTLNGSGAVSISGSYPSYNIYAPELPAGVPGASLYHDGTNWLSSNISLFNNGNQIGMGINNPTGDYRLEIEGNPYAFRASAINMTHVAGAFEGSQNFLGFPTLDLDGYDIGLLAVVNEPGVTDNYGLWGSSNGWGGHFQHLQSSKYVNLGGNPYALQIVDGNEGEGNILVSDSMGNARWEDPVNSMSIAAAPHGMIKTGSAANSFSITQDLNFVSISSTAPPNQKEVMLAIDVPALMNGKQLRLSSIQIEYKVSNTQSYITETRVIIPNGSNGSTITAINDTQNRNSTSWGSYSLTDTQNHNITGPIILVMVLSFNNTGPSHAISVGSVRVNISE